MKKRIWRVAGINFDHFHMGDLLRMAHDHPAVDIVGISDEQPDRMEWSMRQFNIPDNRVFTDYRRCLEETRPDVVILCPATAGHAEWTEKVAPFGTHILMEKPFAASLADADRMIEAVRRTDRQLVINWPLRWVASHVMAKHLVDEGTIGTLQEVHYYGGNRGPLYHTADKIELHPTPADKARSWWYQQKHGGGSLLDYLGYGTTLGTWYHNGAEPVEVTSITDQTDGLEVDEHSITVARYASGLSKFETRWGTFTDPWTHQPQPKCGFILKGSDGTISSYDYEDKIRVQTRRQPDGYEVASPALVAPFHNPIHYLLHCLESGQPVDGPLGTPISRTGQQIVDTAYLSARQKRTLPLVR